MKLTLKRDLPLLLAALLVIWGLWYARPIGVDTLYPELEPDLLTVRGRSQCTYDLCLSHFRALLPTLRFERSHFPVSFIFHFLF